MTKLRTMLSVKTAVALVVTFAVLTVFVGAAQARPLMPGDPEVREIKFQIGSKQYTVQDGTGPVQTFDMDVAPYLKQIGSGKRVMMPMRFVGEAMGASKIEYNPADANRVETEVVFYRPVMTPDTKELGPGVETTSHIIFFPGSTKVVMNMIVQGDLDVPTEIIDGRTFVPLRAAAQGMGGLVFWDSRNQVATIRTWNIPIPANFGALMINGERHFLDRVFITKNSKNVIVEQTDPVKPKPKETITTERPIIVPSPDNPKLSLVDAIQVFKSLFGPVSDKQILIDPINKGVLMANGSIWRPYAQIYITSAGEGDYWLGPIQVRSNHKQNSMFDKKAYMTPDGRILTDLSGFDLAHAINAKQSIVQSFNGTTLVETTKTLF